MRHTASTVFDMANGQHLPNTASPCRCLSFYTLESLGWPSGLEEKQNSQAGKSLVGIPKGFGALHQTLDPPKKRFLKMAHAGFGERAELGKATELGLGLTHGLHMLVVGKHFSQSLLLVV